MHCDLQIKITCKTSQALFFNQTFHDTSIYGLKCYRLHYCNQLWVLLLIRRWLIPTRCYVTSRTSLWKEDIFLLHWLKAWPYDLFCLMEYGQNWYRHSSRKRFKNHLMDCPCPFSSAKRPWLRLFFYLYHTMKRKLEENCKQSSEGMYYERKQTFSVGYWLFDYLLPQHNLTTSVGCIYFGKNLS